MKYQAKSQPLAKIIIQAEHFMRSREDILFSYLFGSAASGKNHAMSDLDIAVYLKRKQFSEKRLTLVSDIIDALKLDDVDLVILNKAPLPLKARIIRTGRLLSDREPFVRHSFESATTRAYLDFSRTEEFILKKRFFHGRPDVGA